MNVVVAYLLFFIVSFVSSMAITAIFRGESEFFVNEVVGAVILEYFLK